MKNTLKNILFWLECARFYSTPITVLTWVVAFVFSLKNGGNAFLGIIALIGICCVHLATNLIDDYFDYKILCKNEEFMNSAQECKCAYLRQNKATVNDLKMAIFIFLLIAFIIGVFLFFTSGAGVLILALIALIIAFGYQKLSLIGLGEIGIIIAYGPLLFEGVHYVMTRHFSSEILILSFACVMFVNTILYAHMLMDFDGDKCSHKKTLCLYLKNKTNALNFILVFYITSYILTGCMAYINHNWLMFLTYLTIPMVLELYSYLKIFNNDKTHLPKIRFWHKPLENWEELSQSSNAPFYFRFFYARNILTNFLIFVCVALLLD